MPVTNHVVTKLLAERQRLQRLLIYVETGDGSCPLACSYCFLAKAGPLKSMSVDTLYAAIDFLREYAHPRPIGIHFFGTEPTKRWDLIVAAREYAPKDWTITLTTNGYLLNEERIKWMKENNVRVTVWSLDGDERHNRFRITRSGKPSHPVVIENLRKYIEIIGPSLSLRGTYTPDDLDLVGRFRFMEQFIRGGPGGGSIELVPDTSDVTWNEAAVAEAYMELADYYEYRDPPSGTIQRLMNRMRSRPTAPPGNGCGTGYHYWSVSPDGSLSLCQGWEERPHMRIGNVWDGITHPEWFERVSWRVDQFHQAGDPYPKPECRTCHAYNYCMGVGWCASEFYRARIGKVADPAEYVTIPTDGYCAHLRGMVTGVEYWLAQQDRERHEERIASILRGVIEGWATVSASTGPQAPGS